MPVKLPNLILPTGYEAQQRAAERKRKIALALMQRGMQTNPNMQSWTQVLGQLASGWQGKRLDKQADELDAKTNEAIKNDYAQRLQAFQEKARGLGNNSDGLRDLVDSAQGDPFLADAAKPYVDAFAARLKESGEHTNFGGQWRTKGQIAEGEYEPNKPTDRVLRGPGNTFQANPVAITSALASQPNVSIAGGITSMRDPMASQPAMPAPSAGGEVNLIDQLSPEDRQIMVQMLQKYAGKGAELKGIVPQAVPYGNPTAPGAGGGQPPDGVTTDGQPYWLINGVPYDNPEGR